MSIFEHIKAWPPLPPFTIRGALGRRPSGKLSTVAGMILFPFTILSSRSTRHGPPSVSGSQPTPPIHSRFSRKTSSPPTGSQRKSASTTNAPWCSTRPKAPHSRPTGQKTAARKLLAPRSQPLLSLDQKTRSSSLPFSPPITRKLPKSPLHAPFPLILTPPSPQTPTHPTSP